MMYVLSENKDEVLNLARENPTAINELIQPLVIRANAGEVIEVTLTSRIREPLKQTFHPGVPVNSEYPPSNSVSINPGLLLFDSMNSGGVTVSYNPDQTVRPGKSITYRWYAD